MTNRVVNAETAIFEQRGPIAIVTLNRPEARNALNYGIHRDVCKMFDEINDNAEIRVAIITAAGDRAFSAGRDLNEYVGTYADKSKEGLRPVDDPNHEQFGKLVNHYVIRKPLIAAINGYAVGGAMYILAMCDLRVMADDTYIADLHSKVNASGNNALAHELPWAVANYLTMCNGRLSAQECLHFGFVNRVVPRAQLMDSALELAEMVLTSGPDSLRVLKEGSLKRQMASGFLAPDEEREQRRQEALGRIPRIRTDEDLLEGMKAFVEKRTAKYEKSV